MTSNLMRGSFAVVPRGVMSVRVLHPKAEDSGRKVKEAAYEIVVAFFYSANMNLFGLLENILRIVG